MMMEQWHRISRERDSLGSAVIIRASAASGSPWFSGHFPGEPILPGLAILAMVKEAILGEETARGRKIRVTGVRRVRFRLTVKPDDMLTLAFSLSEQGGHLSYSFKVSLDGKPVCSGIVAASLLSEGCL
jgi:3-hydroxyacyl-[acyl-carrier-protein] dehydratase